MIIADTHVHIYPGYDLALFFGSAFKNLGALGPGPYFLCLTERSDCHFFSDRLKAGNSRAGAFAISASGAKLSVSSPDGKELFILPGRQVATAERIEVLGLATDEYPPDGTSARACIDFFNQRGAVVVLPWSFGKWSGKRGQIVRELIDDPALKFLIGDPAHRPALIPEPALFGRARDRGRKILCGTDPLPLPNEEMRVGSYASTFNGQDLFTVLCEPNDRAGSRLMPWQSAATLLAMKRAPKSPASAA